MAVAAAPVYELSSSEEVEQEGGGPSTETLPSAAALPGGGTKRRDALRSLVESLRAKERALAASPPEDLVERRLAVLRAKRNKRLNNGPKNRHVPLVRMLLMGPSDVINKDKLRRINRN